MDDGSTDDTPADRPPAAGRAVPPAGEPGARAPPATSGLGAATGDVIAYTDADCVADPAWLRYLVDLSAPARRSRRPAGRTSRRRPTAGWRRCVAASPGGPSHVMLDDRLAEHVPGCNMAFDRRSCWRPRRVRRAVPRRRRRRGRLLAAARRGPEIGYAPAALVWHHRRATVGAYFRQQRGYGRSEAMLQFKHPQRFTAIGAARWRGVIYGDGAVGLPVADAARLPRPVRHGAVPGHLPAQPLFGLGLSHPPRMARGRRDVADARVRPATAGGRRGGDVVPDVVAAVRVARAVRLPPRAPWWCRPLVVALHMAQPPVRSASRYRYWLRNRRGLAAAAALAQLRVQRRRQALSPRSGSIGASRTSTSRATGAAAASTCSRR